MRSFRLAVGSRREATGAGYALALLACAVALGLLFSYSIWPEPVAKAVATTGFFVPLLIGLCVAAGLVAFGAGWVVLRALGLPISRQTDSAAPRLRAGSMTEEELERVRENARAAPTDDLLDRVTAYRGGMDPEALRVIEEELAGRGVGDDAILLHQERTAFVLRDETGVALTCSFCRKPAVAEESDPVGLWGGLVGDLPLPHGPRRYCEDHCPR